MAQYLTHYLNFHSLGKHQAGGGVAKFVRMPISKTGASTDRLELSIQISRVDGRADRRREDVPRINPLVFQPLFLGSLSLLVCEERFQHWIWQIHRTSAERCFRVRGNESRSISLELSQNS